MEAVTVTLNATASASSTRFARLLSARLDQVLVDFVVNNDDSATARNALDRLALFRREISRSPNRRPLLKGGQILS
jgi:hypothetical protein